MRYVLKASSNCRGAIAMKKKERKKKIQASFLEYGQFFTRERKHVEIQKSILMQYRHNKKHNKSPQTLTSEVWRPAFFGISGLDKNLQLQSEVTGIRIVITSFPSIKEV